MAVTVGYWAAFRVIQYVKGYEYKTLRLRPEIMTITTITTSQKSELFYVIVTVIVSVATTVAIAIPPKSTLILTVCISLANL